MVGLHRVSGMTLRASLRPIVAALVVTLVAAPTFAGTDDRGQGEFIQSLANQATEVLADQSKTLEEREAYFRTLLHEGFALIKIGRFVIGRAWKRMSETQREDYQVLYAEWVLKTYSSRLGGYSGQRFKVTKVSKASDEDVFVRSHIIHPSYAQPIIADWRVREIDGAFKVIDIVVEGISMLVTQRSEFAAVIRERGVDGLIETMRARTSKFPAVSG